MIGSTNALGWRTIWSEYVGHVNRTDRTNGRGTCSGAMRHAKKGEELAHCASRLACGPTSWSGWMLCRAQNPGVDAVDGLYLCRNREARSMSRP